MILAIDIGYKGRQAKAVGILFNWDNQNSLETVTSYPEITQEYIPGEFYRKELPCIITILDKVDVASLSCIIIDGYVYTDNTYKPGLGYYVWQYLKQKCPVIGVAKNEFLSNNKTVKKVYRGKSIKPLYISSVGLELEHAANLILGMKGEFRMPDILKEVDRRTKTV